MEQWKDWAKVSAGPYQGKPELTMSGIGESGYVIHVRDRAGNVIKLIPSAPGRTGVIVNMGGAGIIAHLADPNTAGKRRLVLDGSLVPSFRGPPWMVTQRYWEKGRTTSSLMPARLFQTHK